jgi:hypothetical protein
MRYSFYDSQGYGGGIVTCLHMRYSFYDSQGYGGGIVTHLHMRYFKLTGHRLVAENAIVSN